MDLENFLEIGKILYNELLKHPDITFIICPASLGDTINIGAYMLTFKKIYNINKVILVVKPHHMQLIDLFPGVNAGFELSEEEMMAIRFYITINHLEHNKNVIYGYFPMGQNGLWSIEHNQFLNFVDEYKTKILRIPLSSEIDSINTNIDSYYDKHFENAILLFPFCQGNWRCEDAFWQGIISYYKSKGITKIYTNLGNPKDYALENTEGLNLSVPNLLASCHHFHKIIGIRGGIFDALSLRDDVKLDVITPNLFDQFFGKCEIDINKHPLYFGLKYLNPKAKVREYTYFPGHNEELIREITDESAKY